MRKILSFVLVSSLVLGSFSMAFATTPAAVTTTAPAVTTTAPAVVTPAVTTAPAKATAAVAGQLSDIAGNANAEAIQVANDLGIVTGNPDGTYLPEKAVTRAEFAAMITRALAIPDSALTGYKTSKFKDVSGYAWAVPYLAFCESKGIMLGDGAGNVMPGRTINANEAVTMALRAVGYTANSSELVGTWPANYVTKAQELKMYDDVAKTATGVDKANAAQIIYNTITVQKVAVNTDGATKKLWDKEPTSAAANNGVETTLISSGLNCTADDEDVIVSGDVDNSLINVYRYLGVNGTKYRNKDKKIVAFIAEDSTQIVGTMSPDGKTFTTSEGNVEYTSNTGIDLSAVASNFLNGESGKMSAATTSAIEYVINADLSGKTIRKIHSVMQWNATASDKVDAAQVKDITNDKSLLGYKFKKDDDKNIDKNAFALVGVASLDKIAADNIVYVYADKDREITKVEVGTAIAEGIVSNFKEGKDATNSKARVVTSFAIGSKTYSNAKDAENIDATLDNQIDADNVSNTVKAYLDARGFVYDFDETVGGTKEIGIIEAVGTGGINDEVKMFLADGSEKTFTFKANDITPVVIGNAGATKGGIVQYGLNKDGKIDSMTYSSILTPAGLVFKTDSVMTVKVAANVTSYAIDSKVVVFSQKANGDYKLSSIDKVKKNEAAVTGSVLFDAKTGKVIGVVVPDSAAKASTKDVYAVINDRYDDTLDGDKVDRVVGFADGTVMDKKADDKYFKAGTSKEVTTPKYVSTAGLQGVKLFKIDLDAKGIITDVVLIAANGDDHDSVSVSAVTTVTKADSRKSITTLTGGAVETYPLASNVIVYEVNDDDEYVVYTGSFKAGDIVKAYELDDDNDGYEVVMLTRSGRI